MNGPSRPRVVFMGTPEFALPALEAVARIADVVRVVTRPDRPAGRGRVPTESPVARRATELGLDVLKAEAPNSTATREALATFGPDLFVVVAFGAILSPELLRIPRLGCINLHGSLLPQYRGASPVQSALWDGCPGTGVTTLWMDEGIDTGDCILQRWTPIEASDDAASLGDKLARLGGPLLAESVLLAHAGRAPRRPQPREGSYARKLRKRDGLISWGQDAVTVWNRQRAVTPWPGATTLSGGRRLIVTRAWPHHRLSADAPPGTVLAIEDTRVAVACSPGVLLLERVRPESKNEMAAGEWARGARIAPGERLTTPEEIPA
ncbi:MAG TPA: methionyl-tRNA formyltransferase [Candidatus Sulfotelmatobacter sp.]|nr:methionyl-tRNA formyltransferase [Candidatus Sulfotelmatobacter sp.]